MIATDLTGKRVIVVGGGSGIGRAVVEAFLRADARVVALEIDPVKCERLRAETAALVVQGDARLAAPNQEAVALSEEQYGGVDVLVHCAGIFDFYRPLQDIPDDAFDGSFDEMFSVNVRSAMHSVRAAIPALRRSRGTIVLTESTSAYHPGRGGALYVATKFALRGLRIALAHDLAPDIRVNSVAPGGTVGTDLAGATALGVAEQRLDGPDRAASIAARVPLQVALSGDDHAWSYLFLASDMSRGMTGTVLHSDGGVGIKG